KPVMARLVMKFGGTSVADIDRIRNVAHHVKREVDAGHEVAVVVSAMAGATNQLVAWCRDTAPLHDAREYDAVVASGEQVTAGLLALSLEAIGVNARSWQGWQLPILNSDAHSSRRRKCLSSPRNAPTSCSGALSSSASCTTFASSCARASTAPRTSTCARTRRERSYAARRRSWNSRSSPASPSPRTRRRFR